MSQVDLEYQKLVEFVLEEGIDKDDRTGVGTLSAFGYQYRVNLQHGFPLLTTKKINFANIWHELMWFLRGDTNINTLKAPQLWEPWADENGECGPIYGKQWVNWTNYKEHGYIKPGYGSEGIILYREGVCTHQIINLINGILKDPNSRRHIVSAWNVSDLKDMALVPCHTLFQCYVSNGNLDLQLYQRSGDLAIGVPYNIASYAALMHIIAKCTNLEPRFFIHSLGDVHIYKNHLHKLQAQVNRMPKPGTKFNLIDHDTKGWSYATSYSRRDSVDDYELINYNPHPFVKYEVAV